MSSTSDQTSEKRDRVPPQLRKLLNHDVALTKRFCEWVKVTFPGTDTEACVMYMKALELSCHGVPWFLITFMLIYVFRSDRAREIEINLLFGLIYDVMMVAFLKAVTRRTRPSGNQDDMFFTKGVDKFSFPSGHASRVVFLSFFLIHWAIPEMSFSLSSGLYMWCFAVSISRVLLRRHHLLDVAAGIGLGLFEFCLSGILWIGPTASKALGDWIATSSEDE